MSLLDRLLGRVELPAGVAGRLEPQEHVLTAADTDAGRLALTSFGIWLPEPTGEARRVDWHLVSKASWRQGVLTLVEAAEVEVLGAVVLLADGSPRRLRLREPGSVPETVHRRVEDSIRGRQRHELFGGGAWVVQRKVPGRDGVLLQVRPDPGTDPDAARELVAQLARSGGRDD